MPDALRTSRETLIFQRFNELAESMKVDPSNVQLELKDNGGFRIAPDGQEADKIMRRLAESGKEVGVLVQPDGEIFTTRPGSEGLKKIATALQKATMLTRGRA